MAEGAKKRSVKTSSEMEQTKAGNTLQETKGKSQTLNENEVELPSEFGGPIGNLLLIVWSHFHILYLWICNEYYNGSLTYPNSFNDFGDWSVRMLNHLKEGATPTYHATFVYISFLILEIIFALIMPGPTMKGLPIPSENNAQLEYKCNGAWSWWTTLALVVALHYFNILPLDYIFNNLGPLTTASMIISDIISVYIYFQAIIRKKTTRLTGNFLYDFFMGAELNPRLFGGKLDLKMWAEIRISWMTLFLIALSCGFKFYKTNGFISGPIALIILCYFLYSNACMKGEECIPTTWDIFYEKWGWMLIFWNFAGVPFAYSFQSVYIAKKKPFEYPLWFTIFLFALLFFAYYIWDSAQAQKNHFRMEQRGTYIQRNTFPQLPWRLLKNPKYIKTKQGNYILIDGWWKYARKIHYTVDMIMALLWGVSCGFDNFLPYFYFFFFVFFLNHRAQRDHTRCKMKYGEDWEEYCKVVPYMYIPKVI